MKLEFQSDVIKFLVQSKEARKYVEILEPEFFDLGTQYTVYSLLQGFLKKYKSLPSKGNLLEYFDREIKNQSQSITKELYTELENAIHDAFEPFTGNTEQIREIILEKYQLKLMQDVFKENAGKIKEGTAEVIQDIYREVSKIKKIGDNDVDEAEQNRGQFLLAEYEQGNYEITEGHPTYLNALNKLTSTRGFYAPQLVIFMGAPKSFKTGTLLSIAVNYVRDGYKVYYADAENSQGRIRDRARQCMLECTFQELVSGNLDETLTEQVERFKGLGGDFRADFFPAHTKSMADVEEELQYLKDEYNWTPDIICYDYLDLFKPEDYRIKEKRLQIQAVYFDAIRLQKRWGIFGLSLSQVSRGAVDKKIIDMTGFAEDFGKAANCHAAFALCRTPEEKEAGVMRIVPVVQRDGQAQHAGNAVFVDIDESRMRVAEIDKLDWEKKVADVVADAPVQSNKKRPQRGGRKPIRDE